MEAKQNKKAELLFTVCCARRFWVPLRKGDGGRGGKEVIKPSACSRASGSCWASAKLRAKVNCACGGLRGLL